MIPYGHIIFGKLNYSPDIEGEANGCSPFNVLQIPPNPKVDQSPIIMVNRGECSFVTKVRNVEQANGHVALIVNNIPNQSVNSIIMADDGRGMELTIPGILIPYEEGKILKDFWIENKDKPDILSKIVLEVDFEMENPNNFVEYDIWYTPDQEQIYKLIGDFYTYHEALRNQSRLNMHIVTYSHYSYDQSKRQVMDHCLGSGKYCVRPGNLNITKGSDVVMEGIKQKCIYNYAYGNGKEELFWKYMQYFYYNCIKLSQFTYDCSSMSSKQAGLPVGEINKCFAESFTVTQEEKKENNYKLIYPNSLLDLEMEERKNWYINRVPSLFVNKRLFLSSWRAEYLFEGICAGLKKKPEICYIDGYFAKEKKMSTSTIIIIVLLIILVNVVIFYFCMKLIRKYIKSRLDSSDIAPKIDSVVTSYLQMKQTN